MRKCRKTIVAMLAVLSFASGATYTGAWELPSVVKASEPYLGMTYGDWTAAWWQYVIQTPNAIATLFSDDASTSFDCSAGQTSAPVFFLVGGGSQFTRATKTCTVPQGKAIFFPIINSECSTLEPPGSGFHGDNEYQLRTCASSWVNPVNLKSLKVTVDGLPLSNLQQTRVQSPVFTFKSPDTAGILGFEGDGSSVSDGYWVLLKPLSPGKHIIHFEGSAPAVNNYQDVTYKLTVK
jgi:hypothetical protein